MQSVSIQTPAVESSILSSECGVPVILKLENLQPSGSFKLRGMEAACRIRLNEGYRKVVCASGGNAGYSVAYVGKRLGLITTIVVPKSTSSKAMNLIRNEEAELIIHGESWDSAHSYAVELAKNENSAYIHPFDDPLVWKGHSRIVEELYDCSIIPKIIVTSVGGGGLLCGLVEGLRSVGWNDVSILAVETYGTESFYKSVRARRLITLDKINSVATSLGAKRVALQALESAKIFKIIPWLVGDRQAIDACMRFANDHRMLVEPACGASLAAAYYRAEPLIIDGPVVIVVCGGVGVTLELLNNWDKEIR